VHALSSFQRTKAPGGPFRPSDVPYRLRFCFDGARQGNLTRLPHFSLPRQPFPFAEPVLRNLLSSGGLFVGSERL
jgi:hypothetical protein